MSRVSVEIGTVTLCGAPAPHAGSDAAVLAREIERALVARGLPSACGRGAEAARHAGEGSVPEARTVPGSDPALARLVADAIVRALAGGAP